MSSIKRGRPPKRGKIFRNVHDQIYFESTHNDDYRWNPTAGCSLSFRNNLFGEIASPKTSFRAAKIHGVHYHSLNSAKDKSTKNELKKLSIDQNDNFMVDFDLEKSQKEMCKINRRSNIKETKKHQLYDDKGVLLETHLDLCDCLEKLCPGCHLPCQRCGSLKCGTDCRCHRKFTIDTIEVEGTYIIFTVPI